MKLNTMNRLKVLSGIAACGILAAAQPVTAASLWTSGHGDIGIGYEGGALEPHWHLGEDNETVVIDGVSQNFGSEGTEFEADEIIAFSDRTEIRPVGAPWDPVGVSAGALFFVFPFTEDPTVPFLGLGTEELDPGDWLGNLTITLTGLSGSGVDAGGVFSAFTTDTFGTPTFPMSSSDGISGADAISQAAGEHAHFNWAFTEAGRYDVTFQVSGNHAVDGIQTASGTFGFVVPEPSRALLLLTGGLGMVLRRRRGK